MPADTPPLRVSLVVQMDGLHSPSQPESHFSGDLETSAKSWCEYFVHNLGKLTQPRGGDLFVLVQLTRGDERAGHEYRDGRFVRDAPTPNPSPAGSNPGGEEG